MGTFRDLKGQRFGRLMVLERGKDATNTYGRPIVRWQCQCDCGSTPLVRAGKLTGGWSSSCGCLHHEKFGDSRRTHGKRHTRAYLSWAGAKNRCTNPNNAKFPCYGARGIKMCDRWMASFEEFYAEMGDPPEGKSLDRYPDRDGNYEPGNVRWATPAQQSNNLRTTRFFEFAGRTLSISEWAAELGVSRNAISLRLKRGSTMGKIVSAFS